MTVQEKLDLFEKRTMESVVRKRSETTSEIQESIKIAVREAEKDARQAMSERIKAETGKLDLDGQRRIHAAYIETRREFAILRERLAEELFAELESDLREFVAGDEYQKFLQDSIKKAQKQISSESHGSVEIASGEDIGGFRLVSSDGRAVADYTMLTRLKELKDEGFWHKWPDTDSN